MVECPYYKEGRLRASEICISNKTNFVTALAVCDDINYFKCFKHFFKNSYKYDLCLDKSKIKAIETKFTFDGETIQGDPALTVYLRNMRSVLDFFSDYFFSR